jgi:hypothetical protein
VLEQAARDAATPEPDVEQDDPAPHLDPRLVAQLTHAPGCHQDRLEAVAHGVRCLGCGAAKVVPPPEPLPPSDSDAYRRLWRNHPSKIVEALTDAQRADPRLNPQHPNADAEPPAWFGGRPTR